MPPVARAQPVKPGGAREERLYLLVDERFGNVMDFARKVSKLTGLAAATEKRAYYRIIEGKSGDRVEWRLRQYAKVLGLSAQELLRDWEEPADQVAAVPTDLPLNLTTRQLRDALQALTERVDRLSDQVERLGRRGRSRRQREGKSA